MTNYLMMGGSSRRWRYLMSVIIIILLLWESEQENIMTGDIRLKGIPSSLSATETFLDYYHWTVDMWLKSADRKLRITWPTDGRDPHGINWVELFMIQVPGYCSMDPRESRERRKNTFDILCGKKLATISQIDMQMWPVAESCGVRSDVGIWCFGPPATTTSHWGKRQLSGDHMLIKIRHFLW